MFLLLWILGQIFLKKDPKRQQGRNGSQGDYFTLKIQIVQKLLMPLPSSVQSELDMTNVQQFLVGKLMKALIRLTLTFVLSLKKHKLMNANRKLVI